MLTDCELNTTHLGIGLQEENIDEAVKAAFHAWTAPGIRGWRWRLLALTWGNRLLDVCVQGWGRENVPRATAAHARLVTR
jgi:hypothetical protein